MKLFSSINAIQMKYFLLLFIAATAMSCQSQTSITYSKDSYQQLIQSDDIVLVDFFAPWCGPCKQMEPLLNEMAAKYKGKATIVRINIDDNKELVKTLRIDEIPFFKYYVNGEEKGNFIGQIDKATFERLLNPAK